MQATALFSDLRRQRRDGMKMQRQGKDANEHDGTDPAAQLENRQPVPINGHGRSDNPAFWACQTGFPGGAETLMALKGISRPG